ncbi:RNA polymerase sigma factor [uncultured Adlercreutzia sp.]|uniref:RNA polymerase sigma factor n=1 Tax=uncultured Adlercreutzia sp. TaxID=875803 RepID=UPI0034A3E227
MPFDVGGDAIDNVRDIERAFNEYGDRISWLAMRYFQSRDVADDIVQETFLRLCRTKKEFASETHLENWLIKVASNLCKNRIRRLSNHPTVEFDDNAVATLDQRAFTLHAMEESEDEARDFLLEHLEEMPDGLREIVNLRYFEERDIADIAKTTGLSEANAYVKLHRARKFLREKIRKEGSAHA